MTVFGLSDFADWQKRSCLREYILDSDNTEQTADRCFAVCLRFPSVSVSASSRRIVFRDGKNSLTLNRVKEVRLDEDPDLVGTVFDVVCLTVDGKEIVWRFLAD